jgi:hypothetical protein
MPGFALHDCCAWCVDGVHAEVMYAAPDHGSWRGVGWVIDGRPVVVDRIEPAAEAPLPAGLAGTGWSAWTVWFRWADQHIAPSHTGSSALE